MTKSQEDRVHVPYVASDREAKSKLSNAIKEIPLVHMGRVSIKVAPSDTSYAFEVRANSSSDAMRLIAGLRDKGYGIQGDARDWNKFYVERGGYSYPKNR